MFRLKLRLENADGYPGVWKRGVEALDLRRAAGLPDGDTLPHAAGYCGATDRTYELPEELGRVLLGGDTERTVTVTPEDLLPDEVCEAWYFAGYHPPRERDLPTLGIKDGLPLPRALEILSVARQRKDLGSLLATTERQGREIERLKARVAELEAELIPAE